MKKFRVGTSGYNNFRWQGIFYPDDLSRSKWFEYYCRYFDTFEINSTFYKFPTVRSLKTWHQKSPEDFKFAVKAPKTITHINRLTDSVELVNEFYEVCNEGLRGKFGAALFQFPPSFKFNSGNLELITKTLNPEFKNVIEFRNAGWWNQTVFSELSKNDLSFASVSYPGMPKQIIDHKGLNYIRLHGVPKLFYSEYGAEFLDVLKKSINSCKAAETFVFFNNTASAAGISDALTFRKLLSNVINV